MSFIWGRPCDTHYVTSCTGGIRGFAKVAKQEAFSHSSHDQLFEFLTDATPSAAIKLEQVTDISSLLLYSQCISNDFNKMIRQNACRSPKQRQTCSCNIISTAFKAAFSTGLIIKNAFDGEIGPLLLIKGPKTPLSMHNSARLCFREILTGK